MNSSVIQLCSEVLLAHWGDVKKQRITALRVNDGFGFLLGVHPCSREKRVDREA
jgi:hypothetical protein